MALILNKQQKEIWYALRGRLKSLETEDKNTTKTIFNTISNVTKNRRKNK